MRFPRISDYKNEIVNGKKICRNCDKPVTQGRRHYCSQLCMEQFNDDHNWHTIRKTILRNSKYRCSICNKRYRKTELDIDHIIPIRMGGRPFNKNNLRVLCKDCHKMKTKLDQDVLNELECN